MGGQLPSLLKSIVWQRDVISLKHVSLYRHMYLAFCILTSWQSSFVEIGLGVYGQWTLIEESLEIAALLYMEINNVGTCNTETVLTSQCISCTWCRPIIIIRTANRFPLFGKFYEQQQNHQKMWLALGMSMLSYTWFFCVGKCETAPSWWADKHLGRCCPLWWNQLPGKEMSLVLSMFTI